MNASGLNITAMLDKMLEWHLPESSVAELQSLKAKASAGDLTQNDRSYVVDCWNEPAILLRRITPQPPQRAVERRQEPDVGRIEEMTATIVRLREAGKRAVAQRDHWELQAKALERQLIEVKNQSQNKDYKFEQAKRVFAKLYHPNSLAGLSPLEKIMRGEIFKEFWAELERIERGDS